MRTNSKYLILELRRDGEVYAEFIPSHEVLQQRLVDEYTMPNPVTVYSIVIDVAGNPALVQLKLESEAVNQPRLRRRVV